MAITFDAASQAGGASTVTQSWTHAQGSLTDGIVVAMMQCRPTAQISGTPTYDGNNMTLLTSYQMGGSIFDWTYFYYYLLGTSAAANKTVSFTIDTSAKYNYTAAATYSGVDQTNPFGSTPTYTTNSGASSTSLSGTLTTIDDNAWLVGMGQTGTSGGGVAAGTDTTRRATSYADYGWHAILDSNGAKTPTGSYSLQHTGSADRRGIILAQLKPAGGSPASTQGLMMMM